MTIIIIPRHIHLVIGLPGSGKSYYIAHSRLAAVPCFDDLTDMLLLPPAKSTVREFAIVDVNFCDAGILARAEEIFLNVYGAVTFHHHYFENDPDKCRANVVHRADGRNVEGTIRRFAPIYNPPADAMKIWSKNEKG